MDWRLVNRYHRDHHGVVSSETDVDLQLSVRKLHVLSQGRYFAGPQVHEHGHARGRPPRNNNVCFHREDFGLRRNGKGSRRCGDEKEVVELAVYAVVGDELRRVVLDRREDAAPRNASCDVVTRRNVDDIRQAEDLREYRGDLGCVLRLAKLFEMSA